MSIHLFSSESIHLRAFEQSDVDRLHAILNHQEITGRRYIPWRFPPDVPLSSKQVDEIIQQWTEENKGFHLAIITQTDEEIVGHTYASWGWDPHSPDVGVVIDPHNQQKGLGTKSLEMVINYLIDRTPAHNISTWVSEWNKAGFNFATNFGFHDSGRMRRAGIYGGKAHDVILMDFLRSEWTKGNAGEEHGA